MIIILRCRVKIIIIITFIILLKVIRLVTPIKETSLKISGHLDNKKYQRMAKNEPLFKLP